MRYLVGLVMVGCAASPAKAPLDDRFDGLDEKADSFSYRMKIVGSLDYGQAMDAAYTKTPRYRAVKFAGKVGDKVDVWVRSDDGDAVAWVLDNGFHVLGSNDDADDSTLDSHIALTLPASANDTHYVVFRDYGMWSASFSVELAGPPAYDLSCKHDEDCAAVPLGGCCPDGTQFAVNASFVDEYAAATACTSPPQLCPQHHVLDTRVAECNAPVGSCELVEIKDILCGAHTSNSHGCPDGYQCNAPGTDAPGHCVAATP